MPFDQKRIADPGVLVVICQCQPERLAAPGF
jgi:hypothetical protein